MNTNLKPVSEVIPAIALWKQKANAIAHELCKQSYMQANYVKGVKRKRHIAYSVPQEAIDLLACVDRNDEIGAKQMFHYNYAISKL